MGSYYKHTKKESVDVPYSFRCEQCGKESGKLRAQIVGPVAQINSNFKKLNEKKQAQLNKMAHEKMIRRVREVYQDATEKQIYATDFKDKCPHCQKPQSWAVGGVKKEMYSTPLGIMGAGVIFGLGCYFFSEETDEDVKLRIALMVGGVICAVGLGVLAFNYIKLMLKKRQLAGLAQNLPEIEWGKIQDVIDEGMMGGK